MVRLTRRLLLLIAVALALGSTGACNLLLSEAEQDIVAQKKEGAVRLKPANSGAKPEKVPADQEISVNLVFAGFTPTAKSRELDFDFKVLWGEYKYESSQIQVPLSAKKGETSFDLGEAKLRIIPKIVSDTKGKYEVEVMDRGGRLMGRFDVLASGKQVELNSTGSGYFVKTNYYERQKRLTGFTLSKASDQRHPEMGLIFVGKGWEAVERIKKPDMSKGYLFPEMDIVILPKTWMQDNDMQSSCKRLKGGTAMPAFGGGTCYS